MFNDAYRYVKNWPEYVVGLCEGRLNCPSLHPVSLSRSFQMIGPDDWSR